MALSTKTIKTRIRSIQNTKKITKAMELVAAAKMRKTVGAVLSARPYSQEIWSTVLNLVAAQNATHPLLTPREETKNVCVVLISSNRGLCGGFNTNIVTKAVVTTQRLISQRGIQGVNWIALGKKSLPALARTGQPIIAEFEKPDVATDATAITPIVKMVRDGFLDGSFDQVLVAYTDYASALIQKPRVRQLLPIELVQDPELGNIANEKAKGPTDRPQIEYVFEPSAADVLDVFLPRLIEIQLYQALLESNASEHSARMLAMRNATDAAADMMSELTLAFNQARQAGITREIAEIAGGKAALE